MVEKLFGNWKLEKNENFDEYMRANKVNMVLRKVGNTITSYEAISKDEDGTWTINITSTFKNSKLVFKLDEPFTEKTMDGRTMTSTFSIDGDKLKCVQEPISKGDIPSTFYREVQEDGKMLLTCISMGDNQVEAKRYFQPYTP